MLKHTLWATFIWHSSLCLYTIFNLHEITITTYVTYVFVVAVFILAETTKINDKYIGITIGSVAAVLVGIAVLIGLVVIKKR